jgi:hypothetical protein
MRPYFKSAWVIIGLALLLVGAGPLFFIIVAAALGLWPDPNPKPIQLSGGRGKISVGAFSVGKEF